jgi:hypothetical protein
MLDRQNQGPQCTACGSPMKLTAIEPGGGWAKTSEPLLAPIAEGFSGTSSTVP